MMGLASLERASRPCDLLFAYLEDGEKSFLGMSTLPMRFMRFLPSFVCRAACACG